MRTALTQRLHISWHIAWMATGVLIGTILAAMIFGGFFGNIAWLITAIMLAVLCVMHRTIAAASLAFLAGLLIGLWRGGTLQVSLQHYPPFYNQVVKIQGVVAEDTTLGPSGNMRLQLQDIQVNQQKLPGKAWIDTSTTADIKRGDSTTFEGKLSAGFGSLAATMYRAKLVAAVRPQPGDVGRQVRDWFYGRTIHPLVLLPFAAAITVLVNPFFIWGDVGWYLSFAAFTGLLLLAPLLSHFFYGKQPPSILSRIFIETTAAQTVTLPIIAFIFGQLAPLALPANLFVLPLIPATMLLTFLAGLGGVFIPGLATLAGFPATALLHYITGLTNWMAQLPWASYEVKFGIPALICSYVLLLFAGWWLKQKTKHSFTKDSLIT